MLKPKKHLVLLLLLWAASFLVYSPSLRGGFLWDDDAYISQNNALTTRQGLYDIWFTPGSVQQYYPVTFTVFWVARHLWGLNPLGYHAVNIVLHGTNAFLLGVILESLALPGAWIAAFLFALHPVMAESVAWMTELKNVLSTFFYLLTVLALLKKNRSAMFLFAAALLSKSITVTLPVSFLFIATWMRGRWDKRHLVQMLPFLGMSIAMALYTTHYEHHLVRAEGSTWDFTTIQRIGIAGRAFWFYLGKLFYPSSLSFIYPRWLPPDQPLVSLTWAAAAFSLLAIVAYGRPWWGKVPFACLLFFAVSLLPALGLTSFYFMRFSFVADHFQYLASIGVFALLGWAMSRGLEKLGVPPASPVGILVLFLLCADLGLATANQSRKYIDSVHLWQDTLEHNPESAIAHHNLGIALTDRRQWREAIAHLRMAEALDPTFRQTHVALAYFAVHAKHWDVARHEYQEAIRLGEEDPQILKDFAALPKDNSPQNKP